jgi:hypothetical protein
VNESYEDREKRRRVVEILFMKMSVEEVGSYILGGAIIYESLHKNAST